VQGRYDIVCPPVTADALARAWPEARYVVVPDAGHSALEPGIRAALVNATENFRLSTSDTDLFAPRFPWET
jgi:proline iminopeptidase